MHGSTRLRVEVPGLFEDPARARRIERAVSAMAGVLEVRANHRTGTVLCVFDVPSPSLRVDVLTAIGRFSDPDAPPPPSLSGLFSSVYGSVRETIKKEMARSASTEGDDPSEAKSPWHAMEPEEVARAFRVDPARGLDTAEAYRIAHAVGPNELGGVAPRTSLEILAGQVFTVPTALLAGAAGLSVLLGDMLEAGAILLVVGSNIVVGYFTESRAEELLDAWGKFRVEWARVVRDGRETTVKASELVPGDILLVRGGDAIAADARIVEANELSVDESTLTGESEPAEKRRAPVGEGAELADRHGMLYAGTVVASGEARAVVVATGQATELGTIQRALSRAEERRAPLERQLDQLGRKVGAVSLVSAAAVTALGLMRGQPVATLVRNAVALGVAAIPEGIPAVGTTALALASQRLSRKGIVIRRLAAAETLGAVGVICADKTGTLTENRMRVAEVFVPGQGLVTVDWAASPGPDEPPRLLRLVGEGKKSVPHGAMREIGRIAALNADVELGAGDKVTSGSGTERALVEFAMAIGYPVSRRRRAAQRVREERRSADRPFMVTVHEHPDLGCIELVKGAPEQVIELCGELDRKDKQRLVAVNEAMASRGLRVLALAWRRDGNPETNSSPLAFAGLVGLRDPARKGVREALAELSHAGIRTMMLTGDQHRTAEAIGGELGILRQDVYSRVTPEAKLDVVRELQEGGAIVAMTGDGVNDGPALKAADVGVAMGERGTDLARAVADVVLAHDDLPSLAGAVGEGRRLYDNVRRAIDYLVATNTSEVMACLFGAVVGVEPLSPLQLLWINMLTDVAPALGLALEPPDEGLMQRPPRDPSVPLFGREQYAKLGRDASKMVAVALGAYGVGALGPGGSPIKGRTMSFASLVTAQLLHARACRAQTEEPNPELSWAIAASFGLQAAALGLPALSRVLGGTQLGIADLSISLALGVVPTLVREGRQLFSPQAAGAIVVERKNKDSAQVPPTLREGEVAAWAKLAQAYEEARR
ncbi:cation-translocating P-type ATPase [Polyangium aurulentum]|uniref:cation-translocating P-type ATPase n=1 Tax=Polyangium aurulentum TaxID=2567896 RepID=UPI001F293CC1|nr:cation-transporting P-type ATPase [Polyangium aurulentum]